MKYSGNILGLVQQQSAGNMQRAMNGYGNGEDPKPEMTEEERAAVLKKLREQQGERQKDFDACKIELDEIPDSESDERTDLVNYTANKTLKYMQKYDKDRIPTVRIEIDGFRFGLKNSGELTVRNAEDGELVEESTIDRTEHPNFDTDFSQAKALAEEVQEKIRTLSQEDQPATWDNLKDTPFTG